LEKCPDFQRFGFAVSFLTAVAFAALQLSLNSAWPVFHLSGEFNLLIWGFTLVALNPCRLVDVLLACCPCLMAAKSIWLSLLSSHLAWLIILALFLVLHLSVSVQESLSPQHFLRL